MKILYNQNYDKYICNVFDIQLSRRVKIDFGAEAEMIQSNYSNEFLTILLTNPRSEKANVCVPEDAPDVPFVTLLTPETSKVPVS